MSKAIEHVVGKLLVEISKNFSRYSIDSNVMVDLSIRGFVKIIKKGGLYFVKTMSIVETFTFVLFSSSLSSVPMSILFIFTS